MKSELIKLNGLTDRQRFLADCLWECSDTQAVRKFVTGLPTSELRNEAAALVKLITIEAIDLEVDGTSVAQAKRLINRVKRLD